ncbi:PEP-CTERM sorting domain-containing protein [Rubritalea tangerina]
MNTLAAGVLAGGMMFSGDVEAANIVVDGGFEGDNTASGAWGAYNDYSHPYSGLGGPQLTVIGTLNDYGYNDDISLDAGAEFHGLGGGSQTIDLTSGGLSLATIAAGDARFAYSAWLAGYNGDNNTVALQLEWLDAGNSVVGSTLLLDRGVTTNQVTTAELIVEGADNGAAADPDYWALYEVKGTIDTAATQARITFVAGTGHVAGGANDWYADNVVLDVVAVPEPSSTALIGLGGLALILRRRK